MPYPIIEVEKGTIENIEQLGSKPKFWFSRGEERWLFKEARAQTGEDWAEKIAAEIASRLGMPAARVDLASFEGVSGSATLDFVDAGRGEALVHGNELLAGQVLGYDKNKRHHQSNHTLENIRAAIEKMFAEDNATAILQTLGKYAAFDALIGNTDRHHENWGLLFSLELATRHSQVRVAPSFDHASSLGRELNDAKRLHWLEKKGIRPYIKAGRGGIYFTSADSHGANPLDLVLWGALRLPEYFSPGIAMIRGLDFEVVEEVVRNIPDARMSETAKRFVVEFIATSLAELRR